jgi:hypothetical protein
MEEDVEPEDEDGVDGRGVYGWDGWVCGLGTVGVSSIFGLVRRSGPFATVLLTFVLVSRIHLVEQYRGHGHFLSVTSSSRHESMVGGVLTRTSTLCVGLGVGGATVTFGSRGRPSHSCDGWVCDLGVVGPSSICGLICGVRRGTGPFATVGRPSPLGRALAHRMYVMGGCVIWVWWVPHPYLG